MKFSKLTAVIVVLLFGCFVNMFAQTATTNTESQIAIQQTETSSVESSLPIQSTFSTQTIQSSGSSIKVFLRMILVLIFVVACMYIIVRFMKNGLTRPENTDPFLRRVSSVTLTPGKSIQVVTLLDHAYLVGVSDSSINLIGQVDDKELVDAMNLYADKNATTSRPRNFNDILSLFMPNSAENKNVFNKSSVDVTELLKKQRERLNNLENGGEE